MTKTIAMAKNILDRLNELDASSEVTPQEFQKVWGISKEEHLNRMMDYVHKRKAQAAEEEKSGVAELKKLVAELKQQVEKLQMEVNLMKKAIAPQASTTSDEKLFETIQKVSSAISKSPSLSLKKGRHIPIISGNMLFSMSPKDDGVFIQPVNLANLDTKSTVCEMEDALGKMAPKRRKK